MKTLLTGHQGFVGHRYDKLFGGSDPNLKVYIEKTESWDEYVRQLDLINKTTEIRTILAIGAISNNQYKGDDLFLWNVEATKKLVEIAKKHSSYLVYISSQTAKNPETLYGHSKLLSEEIILESGVKAAILRPFNIYGYTEFRKARECRSLPFRLASHELKVLWDTERDYVHVDDVCNAIFICVENQITGIYEIGTATAFTSEKLASKIKWINYKREPRPKYIAKYNCADRQQWVPNWRPKKEVLTEITKIERFCLDPTFLVYGSNID